MRHWLIINQLSFFLLLFSPFSILSLPFFLSVSLTHAFKDEMLVLFEQDWYKHNALNPSWLIINPRTSNYAGVSSFLWFLKSHICGHFDCLWSGKRHRNHYLLLITRRISSSAHRPLPRHQPSLEHLLNARQCSDRQYSDRQPPITAQQNDMRFCQPLNYFHFSQKNVKVCFLEIESVARKHSLVDFN